MSTNTYPSISRAITFFLLALLVARCGSPDRQLIIAGTTTYDTAYISNLIKNDPFPGQLSWMEMKLEPFVFNSAQFPAAEFAKPDVVRRALGNYTITTEYYNAAYQKVTVPGETGRYGAVVNIQFESGTRIRRFYTLYHYNGTFSPELDWWRWASSDKEPVSLRMPSVLEVSSDAQSKHINDISVFVRFGFYEDLQKRPYAARLIAGLHESKSDENINDVRNDVIVKDRQWWIRMKQRLQPSKGAIAQTITGPQLLVQDSAASTLANGTPEAAGMMDKVVPELEEVLSGWAKASGEAFGVTVARNGVIFFRKAYGQRDNALLTLNDKSHIASINKTLTSILLMMCVERGLISLDDEISKYFPTLKDAQWNKPITIRHLVTHTSGLPDLTLDELNDLEEVIKPILPAIKVGGAPRYAETGYSLCGKIMEVVTGKTIAALLKEWLVDPLQLSTRAEGAASDAWSTPMDLAKIGQLLLNKGTYGNVRYFSEDTYNKMLPSGSGLAGVGLTEYNIGFTMDKQLPYAVPANEQLGFSKVLGHPASSASTFAIDPVNRLVIIMTRNNPGAGYQQYNEAFLKTITSNIIKDNL